MRPDTCAPTCTVTSGDSVPVAVTRATTRPRSTAAVVNLGGLGALARAYQTAPPAITASTSPAMIHGRRRFTTTNGPYLIPSADPHHFQNHYKCGPSVHAR